MGEVDRGSMAPGERDVRLIDLNADLGEGFGTWRLGDDEALLAVVTSANVACGFHAGDATTMRRVCRAAFGRHVSGRYISAQGVPRRDVTGGETGTGVAIGAQVSYRDLPGFGRRRIEYDPSELRDEIIYQIAALDGIARTARTRVTYVKPHGALYNSTVWDEAQANAIINAVGEYATGLHITGAGRGGPGLAILGLPGSALLRLAEKAGLQAIGEGFADRGYRPDGTLVPRSATGALITDPAEVAERAVRMATSGEVVAVDGTVLTMPIRSICVHGDTPGAVAIATEVSTRLTAAGLTLAPFS